MKAALNAAHANNRDRLPPVMPSVIKRGLRAIESHAEAEPVARDNQILSDAAVGRLLTATREIDEADAWDGDLFRLILVLTATGARFSQVARIRVRDFQPKERRLLVPVSRKGRGGVKALAIAVPVGADVVEALAAVAADRAPDAPLLERWRSVQKPGGVEWIRDERGAWRFASELTRPGAKIRQRAGLPDVVVYALRHTSIVRAVRANLPLRLIAAMHDTSTAMIERHYAKWIATGLEDMARAAIVPLVPDKDGAKVIRLRGGDP